MILENYIKLKEANKASISKDTENGQTVYKLTYKRYDSETGEAISDKVKEITLKHVENEKSSKEREKSFIESDIASLDAIISDIKSL